MRSWRALLQVGGVIALSVGATFLVPSSAIASATRVGASAPICPQGSTVGTSTYCFALVAGSAYGAGNLTTSDTYGAPCAPTTGPTAGQTCTDSYTASGEATPNGPVTDLKTGVTGEMNNDCSISDSTYLDDDQNSVNAQNVPLTDTVGANNQPDESGTIWGTQNCGIDWTFSGGSTSVDGTLIGTLIGTSMKNAASQVATFTETLTILSTCTPSPTGKAGGCICPAGTAGPCNSTGFYAGEEGSGTIAFSQDEASDFRSILPNLRAMIAFVAAKSPQTVYTTVVHKGAPGVAIAYAGPAFSGAIDPGLRLIATPTITCSATAVAGAKHVALGSTRMDAHGTGLVTRKLAALLKPGRWTITASCGKATVSKLVLVH